MKKCAITLEYCQEIGGSNALLLDTANILKNNHGYEVTFYVFQLSDLVEKRIKENGHNVIDLFQVDPFEIRGKYDLVWGAHWPVLGVFLLCGSVEYKNLILHSMSPFISFERILIFTDIADLILFNSKENLDSHDSRFFDKYKSMLFPNSLPENFFSTTDKNSEEEFDFSYVGNHYTPEIMQALEKLEKMGYKTRKTGRYFGQSVVDEKYIDSTRVIITIGHTVLKSLARKKPVYVYDRFGGPGYITRENFEKLANRNFSGRYEGFKSPENIVHELLKNQTNDNDISYFHDIAKFLYSLERNIGKIIERLPIKDSFKIIDRSHYQNFYILSYSYYAQRAKLAQQMPLVWFTPNLPITHYPRIIDVHIDDKNKWKFISINYPKKIRASNMVKSFQLDICILHNDDGIDIHDLVARHEDGRVFHSIPRLNTPQIHARYKNDERARNCRFTLLIPINPEDRKFDIFVSGTGLENGEERIGVLNIRMPDRHDAAQDS